MAVWIVTGLLVMLLPGTFLGAWNLIEISDVRTAAHLDPSWLQAHAHAQIFGWIASFILSIGFYSRSLRGEPDAHTVRQPPAHVRAYNYRR